MPASKNKFVFVTCGGKEHIETLHFSLAALRGFSNTEIVVVTDTQRNESPVIHSNIVDIATPVDYTHHQASIYLKTGLHRFLPKGLTYCYLDTDVIALSPEVDSIFDEERKPVAFAEDHCSLRQFSPHAVNCNCAQQNVGERKELSDLLQKYGSVIQIIDPLLRQQQRELQQILEVIKRNPFRLMAMVFRYSASGNIFKLNKSYSYKKQESVWVNDEGKPVMYGTPVSVIAKIEKHSAWRWNRLSRRWISPQGNDPTLLCCNHLKQAIFDKFKIDVDAKWQHWNGGVFLFDDTAHDFMENWHQNTLEVLKDPYWKTRDQGTLIATAWQMNLQHIPTISKKFNFIAYFYNPALILNGDEISADALKTKFKPAFIHVFEEFGNNDWDIWQWIDSSVQKVMNAQRNEKSR